MKEIKLTQGKVALVDDEDFEWLNQWKWWATKCRSCFYVGRHIPKEGGGQKKVLMHRFILGITDRKIEVDHKDHNPLNNQRSNLRPATHAQNMANRKPLTTGYSKYLGVNRSWVKGKGNKKDKIYYYWRASIKINGKLKHIGHFKTQEQAALAYNEKAIEAFGEFANPNKF